MTEYLREVAGTLQKIRIKGIPVLFTDLRVKRDSLPPGIYAYDIRHGDNGEFCNLESVVYVNHGGTVLSNVPFEFDNPSDPYIDIENQVDFSDYDDSDFDSIFNILYLNNIPCPAL